MKQLLGFLLLQICFLQSPVFAQEQSLLDWQSVASGAGLSVNGSDVLYNSVGQAIVSDGSSSDPSMILESGFGAGLISRISSAPVSDSKNPYEYKLEQNYPNPFNPMTTIPFSLSERSTVVIKLYDILGRNVKTLLNEKRPAGNHKIVLNATNLASGVYFYRMVAGKKFVKTRKMIVLK